jgi:twinkle protein
MKMIPLTENAIAQLERRGIEPELADALGVASVEPSRATRHDWIAFPHHRRDRMVHWVARIVSEPKPDQWCTQQKDGTRCLWNEDIIYDETLIKAGASLVITEGHLDALALMTVGFRAVTSIPDGASSIKPAEGEPIATAKYAYLADVRDQVRKWPSVIIATDSDKPGRALFDDLARIIGRSKCRVLEYPSDCKDANDILMKHGPDQLVQAVERARWVHIGGIYQLDTLPPMSIPHAVDTGITGFDDLWRIRTGELSVLVGYPNAGKTLLMNQIGMALAQKHDWAIAYCSPEQQWPIHVNRLITLYLEKPTKQASEEEIAEAREFIQGHVIWLAPEGRGDEMTVEWLIERVFTIAWRYNVKWVGPDPYNRLDHTIRGANVSVTEYSGEMLRQLHLAAGESGVHIGLSCHPHKPVGQRDGTPAMPNGYSIADSAHFVNRPDLGATLHRNEKNETTFWCWKARYSDGEWYDNGKCGTRKLKLDLESMRFEAIPEPAPVEPAPSFYHE